MKKITFRKITIQNFLSVGREPVEVEFKAGTNIITGVNKDEEGIANAVGKSTITYAFYFAIFGTTPNDIPKQHIPNRKIGKNCKVVLEFEDESTKHGAEYFVIERTLAPSKVRVFKNDIDKTKSTVPETNKYILDVLSAEEEIFANCVLMQANSTIPFMGKKKTDRKKFIESIFNLSVFGDMLRLLKEDIRDNKHQFDIESSGQSLIEGNINNYREQLQNINEEILNRSKRLAEETKQLKQKISDEEARVTELRGKNTNADRSGLDKIETVKETLSRKKQELYGKIVAVQTQVKALDSETKRIEKIGNACPTCGRAYDDDVCDHNKKRLEEIAEERAQLVESAKASKIEHDGVEAKISQCNAMRRKIEAAVNEAIAVKQNIKYAEKTIEMYREQLLTLPEKYKEDNRAKVFEDMLEKAESEFKARAEKIDEIAKNIGRLNVCEHVLGEQGVRSYVVRKLLDMLNSRIRYYLAAFKSTFMFTFNEFFEEEIKDVNATICTYNNCSGAERKKIDLAISFAFADILKNHRQIEYNLTFFDEILDSSLDSKSLENVVEFITKQTAQQSHSVYIITHKQDISIPNVVETVMLEKKNGFTVRVS